MNYRRGLIRAWILGSLLWATGWLAYIWQSCIPQDDGGGVFCRTSLLDGWMAQPQFFGFSEYGIIVATGISVPMVCLLVGWGIWWVARGFRGRRP
jgi:hypothetical protein